MGGAHSLFQEISGAIGEGKGVFQELRDAINEGEGEGRGAGAGESRSDGWLLVQQALPAALEAFACHMQKQSVSEFESGSESDHHITTPTDTPTPDHHITTPTDTPTPVNGRHAPAAGGGLSTSTSTSTCTGADGIKNSDKDSNNNKDKDKETSKDWQRDWHEELGMLRDMGFSLDSLGEFMDDLILPLLQETFTTPASASASANANTNTSACSTNVDAVKMQRLVGSLLLMLSDPASAPPPANAPANAPAGSKGSNGSNGSDTDTASTRL